jgi:S1-C subfamily serine protease
VDGPAFIPRGAAASLVHFESRIPAEHPSAPLLGEERLGAGVAIAPDRVLTAHYLVMGAERVRLTGADGRERDVAGVAVDHETGLALLSLAGEPLTPASLGRSADVGPGAPIFLLSRTAEGERRGASGHVASVGPFETFWEYMLERAILTTVVNPGLAGAPLFDASARLVGLVSLGLANVGRYSLAIPVDLFHETRDGLESGEPRRPRRAWVGFFPQLFEDGILISGVVPGGPAERAGVARGDLVLSLEGRVVASLRDLYRELWRRSPGESVSVQVLRDQAIHSVSITAADRSEFFR